MFAPLRYTHGSVQKVSANKEDLETLTSRCDLLKDTIVQSIKGKDTSRLPPELMTSIGKLVEYVC